MFFLFEVLSIIIFLSANYIQKNYLKDRLILNI